MHYWMEIILPFREVSKWGEGHCRLLLRSSFLRSILSLLAGWCKRVSNNALLKRKGPVYTERQGRCRDVTSDIALIKLLRFLSKPKWVGPNMGCNSNWSDIMQSLMLMLQINHWRLVNTRLGVSTGLLARGHLMWLQATYFGILLVWIGQQS